MILIRSEKLGYIVRYWKILGPAICKFAFLAIRKNCQFCRIITALSTLPNILSKMVLNLPSNMATGRSLMETCQDCWQPSPDLHASQPFPT